MPSDDEIDLMDYIKLALKHKVLILSCGILGLVLMFFLSWGTKPIYKAEVTLAPKKIISFIKTSPVIDVGTVARILKSRTFAVYVKSNDPSLTFSVKRLQSAIADGNMERIKVETEAAASSVRIANAYAKALSKYTNEYYVVLDEAMAASKIRKKDIFTYCLVGTVSGLFLGLFMIFACDYWAKQNFRSKA